MFVGAVLAGAYPGIAGGLLPVLDLGGFYEGSWAIVDFFLLFVLFTGTARATVGRRLEGREGQLVSLALGAILAVAGVGLEAALGMNLAALGPVAAVVFLLLVGAAVFLVLKKLGLKAVTSAAATVLTLGLGVSAVSPDATGPVGAVVAVIQFGAIGGLGVLGYQAFSHLSALRPGGRLRSLSREVNQEASTPAGLREPIRGRGFADEMRNQKHTIARQLKPITRREEKESARIVHELRLIQGAVRRGGLGPKDRRLIAAAMSRVPPERHALRSLLERVQRIDQALLRFDKSAFRELRQRLQGLSSQQQTALRKLLVEERRKIGIERRIDQVESFVKTYDANAARCLERAGELVVKGDSSSAGKWVSAAVRYEEEAVKMIERTRAVERMLIRLTRMEIRQAQKAP